MDFTNFKEQADKGTGKGDAGGKGECGITEGKRRQYFQEEKKWSAATNIVGRSKKIQTKNAQRIYQQKLVSDLGKKLQWTEEVPRSPPRAGPEPS